MMALIVRWISLHEAYDIERPSTPPRRPLLAKRANATVLPMYSLARLLQIAGLTIPLLAIFAQLSEQISLGQMLGFLVASICVFLLGHLLQRYSGGGPA